jgi:hypothetical protein
MDRVQNLLHTKWPAILWSVIIFLLLAMPSSGLETRTLIKIPGFDKLVHFVLFAAYSFLWYRYAGAVKTTGNKALVIIIGSGCLFGIAMEFVQLHPWVNRDFEWGDMVADSLGAGIIFLIRKRKN